MIHGRSRVAEIMACLMKGPRTVSEITEMTGGRLHTIRLWVMVFHDSGIVRIAGRKRTADPETGTPSRGISALVYELQASPFALEDALPKPKRGREIKGEIKHGQD
jgi:hypothetical protein